MKRYVILLIALMAFAATTSAQSSMTDDQVMQFVVKEHNAGTSQAQIVTKLMQRGVNITQIRRVREKYERQMQSEIWRQRREEQIRQTIGRPRKSSQAQFDDDAGMVLYV